MPEYLPNLRTWLSFLERSFWALERAYIKAFYRNDTLLMDALFDAMCRYSRKHIKADGLPVIALCDFAPLDKRLKDVSL